VAVSIGGSTSKTRADSEGQWAVEIPAMKADGGKPHQLKISATNEIVFKDVLIGDVWIGSGQSNMEWSLKGSAQGQEFIAKANHDKIRLFHIPKVKADAPATEVKATWKDLAPLQTFQISRLFSTNSDGVFMRKPRFPSVSSTAHGEALPSSLGSSEKNHREKCITA